MTKEDDRDPREIRKRADELITRRAHAEGIALLTSAVRTWPNDMELWNMLGTAHAKSGALDLAAAAYERAIAADPSSHKPLANLGQIRLRERRLAEAIELLGRASTLSPDNPRIARNLSAALLEAGRREEAVIALRRSTTLEPSAPVFRGLATTLLELGRADEALAVVEQWLAHEPSSALARHQHAALSGKGVPARASEEYVRHTFDLFAPDFDATLVEGLGYRPARLVETLRRVWPAIQAGSLHACFELGCGTGLMGEHLRPLVARLVGVDLSPKMLELARARGHYDELVEDDLVRFLGDRPGGADLIVAADTFVYFGDLSPVFAAARRSLRAQGRLFFTAEELNDEQSDAHRLQPQGRYAHRREALLASLQSQGFVTDMAEPTVVRSERGRAVPSLTVLAHVA